MRKYSKSLKVPIDLMFHGESPPAHFKWTLPSWMSEESIIYSKWCYIEIVIIAYIMENTVDPYQTLHSAGSDLGLHTVCKCHFYGTIGINGLTGETGKGWSANHMVIIQWFCYFYFCSYCLSPFFREKVAVCNATTCTNVWTQLPSCSKHQ